MRILVLDDQPGVAETLAMSLRTRRFTALGFTSPHDLLAALQEDDVLVLDFAMPEMNGLDVARHAYVRGWRGPLFIMSGKVEKVNQPMDGPHIVSFLKKPFPVETLIQVLFPEQPQ